MKQSDSGNFYDDLNAFQDPKESKKQETEREAEYNRLDYLIHRVFSQSEEGKELIETWKEALIMTATASPGDDMLQVGINEGHKAFIRGILLTLKRVENVS